MSYFSRLHKTFEGAIKLPLYPSSKYVLFSDCHRGTGTSNDNFLKNRNLYLAALKHYYHAGYTYIELGDGDELWENRSIQQIVEAHENIFSQLCCFHRKGRLYMLYGNHDMVKKKQAFLPDIPFYPGIILENLLAPDAQDLYLTHGHQADLFNSTLWPVTRFLVRYLWRPLEHYGVLDPTSAAKNYTRKQTCEKRLQAFAKKEQILLITGHTHRPTLTETDLSYCNSGSCIHPYSITCLEIERGSITLAKWMLTVRPDRSLYVTRETLSGPFPLIHQEPASEIRVSPGAL